MRATDCKTNLTAEHLREIVHYDPLTGVFTWIGTKSRAVKNGAVAGWLHKATGYIRFKVGNRIYEAHRLAWLYMTGRWPVALVDHEDGVRSNNIWTNLRHAWRPQNAQNAGLRRDSSTGLKGVSRSRQKYAANIRVAGKLKFLGRFRTAEAAHAAYVAAASVLFGPFARSA